MTDLLELVRRLHELHPASRCSVTLPPDLEAQEADLCDRGIRVVVYADHLIRSAYPAMLKTANTLLEHGRPSELDAPVRLSRSYCPWSRCPRPLIDPVAPSGGCYSVASQEFCTASNVARCWRSRAFTVVEIVHVSRVLTRLSASAKLFPLPETLRTSRLPSVEGRRFSLIPSPLALSSSPIFPLHRLPSVSTLVPSHDDFRPLPAKDSA